MALSSPGRCNPGMQSRDVQLQLSRRQVQVDNDMTNDMRDVHTIM